MGEPCDICGDIGVLEAFITCSKCKIAREHAYCGKTFNGVVPDVWICEACEMGARISPKSKEDVPSTLMLNPSAMVDEETSRSAGCSELPRNTRKQVCFQPAKTVNTGKVKFMDPQEVIMRSSGAKEFKSPSQINLQSRCGPTKTVASTSARTPIKPKAIPPKLDSQNVKANPFLTRHCNTQINSAAKQQVVQTSKAPKGKKPILFSREEPIRKRQPVDTHIPAVETESAYTKEQIAANKASVASSLVKHFPRTISSGGNGCTNLKSRNLDANDGDLVNILPEAEKRFQGPALDSTWKGIFEILDTIGDKELSDSIQAHPPSKVRRKVYEFSKKMPDVLQFKMLPRCNVWTEIFQEDCPDEYDIGLYFFSSNTQRSGSYVVLLEFIETRDLIMRTYIDGVELFVFTSKLLSAYAQRWKEKHFLWGIFRPDENYKAKYKLNEKLSLLRQPSDSTKHAAAADILDMDIDVLAGKDGERVDRAIFSRESSTGSCGSSKEEIPNAISLNRSSDHRLSAVSEESDFGIQLPLTEVKVDVCDIPPGFDQAYRQKVQNKSGASSAKEVTSRKRAFEVS
ncbi:uncharacterized protein LOC130767389 isoform X1 [Actinidia eriantha]|uniref:uncharacterized protein LOC130767389 isoform X1 n=2 Tax=Actinidia eriantha TaxID=165200 RepID=UPI002586BA80|nr:uncharacterized protein LOC130767389 isoform X1 [Actinidia eriantha]